MIVVGSPGMNVDHADQLHVSPSRLWVGIGSGDGVVNWAADKTLGPNPADSGFGAEHMYVDTSEHSDYWDDGGQSLENQGRIIAGLPPNTRHVHDRKESRTRVRVPEGITRSRTRSHTAPGGLHVRRRQERSAAPDEQGQG
ncbi:alpha/beta hydrolase [Streptomyces narbonensis]